MTTHSIVVAIAVEGDEGLTGEALLSYLRWHLHADGRVGLVPTDVKVTDVVPLQLANVQVEEELGTPDGYLISLADEAMPLGVMPRHIRGGDIVLRGGADEGWVLAWCELGMKYRDERGDGSVIQVATPMAMRRR